MQGSSDYISNLKSSGNISKEKIYPFRIERNNTTDNKCVTCNKSVSFCFYNIIGEKTWYCGYCAACICKVDSMNDVISLESIKI